MRFDPSGRELVKQHDPITHINGFHPGVGTALQIRLAEALAPAAGDRRKPGFDVAAGTVDRIFISAHRAAKTSDGGIAGKRDTQKMPFNTRRSSTRGTPRAFAGKTGQIIDHSKSVSS